jgi:hypothetical protein
MINGHFVLTEHMPRCKLDETPLEISTNVVRTSNILPMRAGVPSYYCKPRRAKRNGGRKPLRRHDLN